MYDKECIKNVKVVLRKDVGSFTSQKYDYLTDVVLEKGDIVVVDTRYGPQVAKVVSYDCVPTVAATKFVISKVDVNTHLKKIEKRRRKAELVDKITQRVSVEMALTLAKELSKKDAELRDMLDLLESLETELGGLV